MFNFPSSDFQRTRFKKAVLYWIQTTEQNDLWRDSYHDLWMRSNIIIQGKLQIIPNTLSRMSCRRESLPASIDRLLELPSRLRREENYLEKLIRNYSVRMVAHFETQLWCHLRTELAVLLCNRRFINNNNLKFISEKKYQQSWKAYVSMLSIISESLTVYSVTCYRCQMLRITFFSELTSG